MLAKKTSKNQLTLPKEIVKDFPNVEYFDVVAKSNKIVLTPVRVAPLNPSLVKIQERIKRLGITEKEVLAAIEQARRKKSQN